MAATHVVVFQWISTILGTVLGVVYGCIAGPLKILPCHPKNKAMAYGFDNVYGPFMGCPGTPLRFFLGIGEVAAGVGLLVGLWGDALGLFGKGLDDAVKALIVVAGCGLMTEAFVAASMHKYVDGSPGISLVLAIVSTIFEIIRLFVNGPMTWANQMLCTWLSVLILVGAVITVVVNKLRGQHENSVEDHNRRLKEMM